MLSSMSARVMQCQSSPSFIAVGLSHDVSEPLVTRLSYVVLDVDIVDRQMFSSVTVQSSATMSKVGDEQCSTVLLVLQQHTV
eukprot:908094-Amphidinium_carterae.1